ncbi:MAG TPA: hypothetical protein VIV11_29850 [Kofleriaceae bacterium]
MNRLVRSSVLGLIVVFALFLVPEARANYEYQCGAHRNAMCHSEPRGDATCAAQTTNCKGRCGPGCDWSALGNAYTTACANHDTCVRNYLCGGHSSWTAHSSCAGSLPSAVGSFVQTHWNNGFQWAADSWSGFWKKVKACCN